MDFGLLPPEVNSARMYAGAGSAPMLAAAAAWNGLATELRSAAASYHSIISGLTSEGWLGPASAAMAAAAAPCAAWMCTTAAQAEQTAAQANAAATAYEAAFAMTVPPPVIAANRAQLMSLVATNVVGQNAPAIAATEAQYGEMWAQDAAAMYGYAANLAAAANVTPFTTPAQTTSPTGVTTQSAAVAQAAGSSAGTGAQTSLSQLISAVPNCVAEPRISWVFQFDRIGAGRNPGQFPGRLEPVRPEYEHLHVRAVWTFELVGRTDQFSDGDIHELHVYERIRLGRVCEPGFGKPRHHQCVGRHQLAALWRRCVPGIHATTSGRRVGHPCLVVVGVRGGTGIGGLARSRRFSGVGGRGPGDTGRRVVGAAELGPGECSDKPGRHGVPDGRLERRAEPGRREHARYAGHARDADDGFGRTRLRLCRSPLWHPSHGDGPTACCRLVEKQLAMCWWRWTQGQVLVGARAD
jgi:hypothetical protein